MSEKFKTRLGLYFIPQPIFQNCLPYLHRLWEGYNIFLFNEKTERWYYKSTKRKPSFKANCSMLVIHISKKMFRQESNSTEILIKCKIGGKLLSILDYNTTDGHATFNFTEIIREQALKKIEVVDFLNFDSLTPAEKLSLCIAALPTKIVIDSSTKEITEASIIKNLSSNEIDGFIYDICDNKGKLLGWTNQSLISKQFMETHFEGQPDMRFVIEMLSTIDVTNLYRTLGLWQPGE